VNDAMIVGEIKRRDLFQHADRLASTKVERHVDLESSPGHEAHHEVGVAVDVAEVVDGRIWGCSAA
jgi:hypothetical protein